MQMTQINQTILNRLKDYLETYDVVYVGLVGSRFWKTEVETSDWDFVAIVHSDADLFESIKEGKLNIHFWGYDNIKNALSVSNPLAWEWTNYSFPVYGERPDMNFLVDKDRLVQRIKENTSKEFDGQQLSYKQSNWKKRYEYFVKLLEGNYAIL